MRKLFRKYLPHQDTVKKQRWLRPLGGMLHHPNLWHLNRHSVSGGVAIGLFCGLVSGPVQMLSAALLAILFRVNLPIAAFTTFYTNPLTAVPLFIMSHKIGSLLIGAPDQPVVFPDVHWQDWMSTIWGWLITVGKPTLVGIPVLATLLAIAGYFTVQFAWRLSVMWRWRARKKRRLCA